MQQRRIRIEKKRSPRPRDERDRVLPLDPRDPDIVRARLALRRAQRHPAAA